MEMKTIDRPDYVRRLAGAAGNGMVKIVTGIRRCGKSHLLNVAFRDWLRREKGVDDRHVPEAANFPSSEESRNDLRDSVYGWLAPGRRYLAVNKAGPDGVYTLCGGTFAASDPFGKMTNAEPFTGSASVTRVRPSGSAQNAMAGSVRSVSGS